MTTIVFKDRILDWFKANRVEIREKRAGLIPPIRSAIHKDFCGGLLRLKIYSTKPKKSLDYILSHIPHSLSAGTKMFGNS